MFVDRAVDSNDAHLLEAMEALSLSFMLNSRDMAPGPWF